MDADKPGQFLVGPYHLLLPGGLVPRHWVKGAHYVRIGVARYDLHLLPTICEEVPDIPKEFVLRVLIQGFYRHESRIPGRYSLRRQLFLRRHIHIKGRQEMLHQLRLYPINGLLGFFGGDVHHVDAESLLKRLLVEPLGPHPVESLVYRLLHAELGIGYRPETGLVDVKPYPVPLHEAVYGVSVGGLDYVFAFRLHFHSSFFISLMMLLMSLNDLTSLTSISWYSIWVLRANASISS